MGHIIFNLYYFSFSNVIFKSSVYFLYQSSGNQGSEWPLPLHNKLEERNNSFIKVTLVSDGGIQEKTHKMDHLMEDMFNDVNYLIACQRFVAAKVRFLEEKPLELTQIIQNLDVSSYKETL